MHKIEAFITALLLIIISGVSVNLMLILSVISLNQISDFFYIIIFSLIFIISLVILPSFLLKVLPIPNLSIWKIDTFNYKRLLLLFTIMLPTSLVLIGVSATIEYFIVAFCEEFLFRHLLLLLLLSFFSKKTTYILGSLLFSIVLHINGDFWINLFTKFPISIILYLLTQKYKLQDAIAFHWLYNVLIYRFS